MSRNAPTVQAPRVGRLPAVVFLAVAMLVAAANAFVTWLGVARYDRSDRVPFDAPFVVLASVWLAVCGVDALIGQLAWRSDRRVASTVAWSFVMVLQVVWTIALFGSRSPGPAFVALAALGASIIVFAAVTARHEPLAAWLVLPLLSWVSFASLLNVTLAS